MLKKINIILLFVILFFINGCKSENINIDLVYHAESEEEILIKKKTGEFVKNNPEININLNLIPFLSLKPYLLTLDDDDIPDLILGVSDWALELQENNIIQKINYVKDFEEVLSLNGEKVGIIKSVDFPAIFYYPHKIDKKPQNIDELFSFFGDSFFYDLKNMYYHLFITQFFENDFFKKNKYNFQDKGFVDSLSFLREKTSGKVPESINYDAVLNMFTSGRIDIIIDGMWNYERHLKNGAEVLPIFPDKIYYNAKAFFIGKNSKNNEEVLKFIKFLMKNEKIKYPPEVSNLKGLPDFEEMGRFWGKGNEILYNLLYTEEDINEIIRRVISK
ncbi:MAG: extracellular solute-binding protein [Candidatus Muiribacteriota bacterium]